MHRSAATAAAALMVLLAAGCGDDGSVTRVGAESSGATVELAAGETLEVRLEANPTTGYQWVVLEPGVVELIAEDHEPESDADGSGGITTLTFGPAGTGTADLRLGYLQPWEDDVEPIDTFTVTVTITG